MSKLDKIVRYLAEYSNKNAEFQSFRSKTSPHALSEAYYSSSEYNDKTANDGMELAKLREHLLIADRVADQCCCDFSSYLVFGTTELEKRKFEFLQRNGLCCSFEDWLRAMILFYGRLGNALKERDG